MNSIEVRTARAEEAAACAALLPNVRTPDAQFLIARRGGRIAGAAALRWVNWNKPPGFPLAIEVVPDARRMGVGKALVAAAIELCHRETAGVWSIKTFAEDSEAADFLRACGFTVQRRVLHFSMDTAAFDDHMSGIVERLHKTKRVPQELRTVSLRDADLGKVAVLVSQSFNRGHDRLLSLLMESVEQGGSDKFDPDLSVVIEACGDPVGAIFGRWNDGNCLIEANVVAPGWRRSSVNALQLAASVRNIREKGSQEFQFRCDDDVIDSINLAKRAGGKHIATEAQFRYELSSSPGNDVVSFGSISRPI